VANTVAFSMFFSMKFSLSALPWARL